MEDIEATSKYALTSALSSIDISVPHRTEGRTTEDCERWSICRLLATLAEYDSLNYPLRLHDQDRPDFRLECGKESIGVEVTEAIPQSYAEADALAEKEYPEALIDWSKFKWGTKKRTVDELRNMISEDKLDGPWWHGDSPEREWAEVMWGVIRGKTQKLRSPEFQRFVRNWLLIYDNLPLPSLILDTHPRYLIEQLGCYFEKCDTFDRIFIETGSEIIELSADGPRRLMINDLWPNG